MKKVCIVGHFGGKKNLANGQTIKTKIITSEIKKRFDNEVLIIDTCGGSKKIIRILSQLFSIMRNVRNIIIMPAQNGVCIIAPFLVLFNIFFRVKLHYIVIGGWLPDFIKDKKFLKNILKKSVMNFSREISFC